MGGMTIDNEDVSAHTCLAAQAAFIRVVNAVARGLLHDTEWSLKRTRRRGRPKRSLSDLFDSHSIAGEYEIVLEDLRAHRPDYRRKRNEPETVWRDRLDNGIRRAWAASSMSVRISDHALRSMSDDPYDQKIEIVVTRIPLPDAVVRRCSTDAIELREEGRPILDHIAYALVGHGRGLNPNSIRNCVQEVRKGTV